MKLIALFVFGLSCSMGLSQETTHKPIVIAHRGASGYLPEHTEGAKVLAAAQGADYVEQDVVLSRDGVFVVCHDITLHETTDVAERFPRRKRSDGKFYVADFDWSELRQLSVFERHSSKGSQQFQSRFPGGFHQRLMQLQDEIQLLQGLSKTLARPIGIYVELKRPAWHRQELGADMSAALIKLLEKYGYKYKTDRCYIQCFERDELKHLRNDLKCQLPLVQLLGGRSPDAKDTWDAEMRETAKYAEAIGPSLDMIAISGDDGFQSTGIVEAAHKAHLLVHPYTIRNDALPKWCPSIDRLHDALTDHFKVDGWFTDFPDLSVAYLRRR